MFARALKHAATAANAEINAYAANHPEYRGMGTTATIAGLLGDTLYLARWATAAPTSSATAWPGRSPRTSR